MSFVSPGQLDNELARQIFKICGRTADTFARSGRIPAIARDAFFSKQVAEEFTRLGLKIPKHIAIKAGISTAKAAQTTATTGAGAITSAVAKASAGQTFRSTLRVGAPVAALFFVAEGALNARRFSKGQITGDEFRRRTVESAATNGGGLVGSAGGAAIGTMILPGVGTVLGALIGGFVGSFGSGKITRNFTRKRN